MSSSNQPSSKFSHFTDYLSKASAFTKRGFRHRVETTLEEHSSSIQVVHDLMDKFAGQCDKITRTLDTFKEDEDVATVHHVNGCLAKMKEAIKRDYRKFGHLLFDRLSLRVDDLLEKMTFMESSVKSNSSRQKATSAEVDKLNLRVTVMAQRMELMAEKFDAMSADYQHQQAEFKKLVGDYARQSVDYENLQGEYQTLEENFKRQAKFTESLIPEGTVGHVFTLNTYGPTAKEVVISAGGNFGTGTLCVPKTRCRPTTKSHVSISDNEERQAGITTPATMENNGLTLVPLSGGVAIEELRIGESVLPNTPSSDGSSVASVRITSLHHETGNVIGKVASDATNAPDHPVLLPPPAETKTPVHSVLKFPHGNRFCSIRSLFATRSSSGDNSEEGASGRSQGRPMPNASCVSNDRVAISYGWLEISSKVIQDGCNPSVINMVVEPKYKYALERSPLEEF
ncbi:hypothetical protein DAKH74_046510 [Maudiozyma humilis]|uniref:BAR domain-containing protein n=1 Tax=Maudiozyma humilis TaxID=51915 RepID=A0AAV5S2V4_MAUHU|nr:hypothetical protein DAKH74_046510 [Kazachstania humilis]